MSNQTQTKFFYDLTPDAILSAVECFGLRCTGRVLQLNSMENRVYEVEIEPEDESLAPSARERFRVVKFYRPGRWSRDQILEEHQFLKDLTAQEIPAVSPLDFEGETLREAKGLGIYLAVFPKAIGRNPDELNDEQLLWIGRLLARMHAVGSTRPARKRMPLTVESYGLENLKFLLRSGKLPTEIQERYRATVEEICERSRPLFDGVSAQRIHGDCHFGNVLWGSAGPFFVDFDDMVIGPCVQDVWLLTPGRDEYAIRQRNVLLEGYEQMRAFDHTTLNLVEPLRALRLIHFSSWIARRWEDPAFPRTFPHFGTPGYWREQLDYLEEQRALIAGEIEPVG